MLTVYIFGLGVWWFLMFVEVGIGGSNSARFTMQGIASFFWPLILVLFVGVSIPLLFLGGDDAKS